MDYEYKNTSIMQMVKTLVVYRGLSLKKLLENISKEKKRSGYYSSFYNKLKNDTIKFSEVVEIADMLGYEIVFKDKKL